MSDTLALTKTRPDVQEQVKRLRNALDASKKVTSPAKTNENRNDQIEKIKAYLEQMSQISASQEKITPSINASLARPIVIGEGIDQFNDGLSTNKIENIFADALLVTAEEIKKFELPQAKPAITSSMMKAPSGAGRKGDLMNTHEIPGHAATRLAKDDELSVNLENRLGAKPVVALEFSKDEYNQFAKILVENFTLFAKQPLQKEQNFTKEAITSLDRYPVVGKYTQKVVESRHATQRFVSEVKRPIPSNFSDWFGGPGFTISNQMREEFSEYLHGKSTQPQAVTRLKKEDKDKLEPPRSVNQSMSHLLQRTKASQEKILNKRSFVELLELLNSVRINGHNNSGFGSGRS